MSNNDDETVTPPITMSNDDSKVLLEFVRNEQSWIKDGFGEEWGHGPEDYPFVNDNRDPEWVPVPLSEHRPYTQADEDFNDALPGIIYDDDKRWINHCRCCRINASIDIVHPERYWCIHSCAGNWWRSQRRGVRCYCQTLDGTQGCRGEKMW